jgi:hypothetical protein
LLLLILAGGGAAFYYYYSKYINIDAIYPGMTIQGMSVGGMTQEEADARYLQLSGGTMTGALHVKDGEVDDEPATIYQLDKAVSKCVPIMTFVHILASGWTSSNDLYTQTVTFEPVSGNSTSQAVFVSPDPSYISVWVDSNIRCVGAVDGGLVFACDTVPGKTITANVTVFPNVSYVEGE